MGNHDDFDLDVRLGSSRSFIEVSQPHGDATIISCGGTCDDANTCIGHNTCNGETCNLISNNTCNGETCNLISNNTCNGETCDTCQGGQTCLGGDTCFGPDCVPVEIPPPPIKEGNS